MRVLKFFITMVMCFFAMLVAAQTSAEKISLKAEEEQIKEWFFEIRTAGDDDYSKREWNDKIKERFKLILANKKSLRYKFDSLTAVGILSSKDKKMRVYTWNIPLEDGSFQYYGFVQYYVPKEKRVYVYELNDKSDEIINAELATLTHENWYGALYYELVERKIDKVKYYVLLGWDGNDLFTNKKVIDVLYFDENNQPQFGYLLFFKDNIQLKRMIFEFAETATMLLKYEKKSKMIIFDHLAPARSYFKGQHEYYGPDFSYDGLKFMKGHWEYKFDIDARNNERAKSPMNRRR